MATRRDDELDKAGFPVGLVPVGLLSSTALRPPLSKSPFPAFSEVVVESVDENVTVDPKTGVHIIAEEDGSFIIDTNPGATAKPRRADKFTNNLAEDLGEMALGAISSKVLMGIQEDDQSRQPWLTDRAEGIKILGWKLEGPRSSIDTTAALEGMSNIRHPMLQKAVLMAWANASGELLPAAGPVKVADKLIETGASNDLAEKLEEDLNYYLTTIATEYYPDMSRALLQLVFGGIIFKKVYNCPLRLRPVSESIDAVNLIVSNAATDLRNSGRYTHVVTMRPSVLRRMQLAGAYRDVPITTPSGVVPNPVQQQIATTQGVQSISQQTEDREHTIYECYCELDIPGYEDKDKSGKATGLPLPYRVVLDKDSTQVLEIRRNWREDDETKTAKDSFVVYVFVPGFGFYGVGLLNMLGNTTNALTAAWRETLDAGMFANFPGFLYAKALGRQNTNEFRVPPGGGVPLDIGAQTDIRAAVMALPYKDVSQAFVGFQDKIQEQGDQVGGVAQIQVAEGRQDAPVGTTLAMLEQATKVEKATHKEMWRSQSREFDLLKQCFRENPESFIRAMRQRGETDWEPEKFVLALNDASLVPQADPNTPSHMHRLMKAMGLIQLDKAYPGILDPEEIVKRVLGVLGYGDFEALKNKNPQQGMPPEMMLEMQKLADKSTDRDFKMAFERFKQGNVVWQAQQAAAAAERKYQHEAQQTAAQAQDNQLQHATDLEQSQMDLRGTEVEARADVAVEQMRAATADVAGGHAVAAEEARKATEDTKGKHAVAAARAKPTPKPAAKKP